MKFVLINIDEDCVETDRVTWFGFKENADLNAVCGTLKNIADEINDSIEDFNCDYGYLIDFKEPSERVRYAVDAYYDERDDEYLEDWIDSKLTDTFYIPKNLINTFQEYCEEIMSDNLFGNLALIDEEKVA